MSRYRRHIGDAEDTITTSVDECLKHAMTSALRALNERAALVGNARRSGAQGPAVSCELVVHESTGVRKGGGRDQGRDQPS